MSQQENPASNLPPESERYSVLRAAIIAKSEALRRAQLEADRAYWLRPDKQQQRIILKHQMSGAQDAHIKVEVDAANKVIYVEIDHNDGRIPVSLLAFHILQWVDLGGEATYDDDTAGGWTCRRTPWRIAIKSGPYRARLVITKQLLNGWDFDLQMEASE